MLTDELMFKVFGLFIVGFTWGIITLYEAFRIQKQKGVVTESRIVFITLIFISILQFLMMERMDIDPILWYGMLGIILMIGLGLRAYFGGKKVTIYETTSEDVIPILKKTLTDMEIPFEEKSGFHNEETVFHLVEEQTKISVEGGILGEEKKDYQLTFKKVWRSYRMEELQLHLIDAYRQQREDKVFGNKSF
ncbi:hypothetical protein H1D32_06005 [Anaerobacillus sp. CMMVII]|uniref:hypothetical protein n=1 Tax=Anaerobacillus sp. CMMVII TaxID=2755588 RepID=UPI0021B7D636|nr:hypothetical protein [Anaerobacillus sp. CMMVII]MCT8137337.1 hypothetical protein [Anaerobacillus sp. CMMVII]